MHYEIDYSGMEPKAKHAKAIEDIKNYLGVPKFKQFCKVVHGDQSVTRDMFIMSCVMFLGIQGYPAEAWADELGLVKTSSETGQTVAESPCKAAPSV